MGEGYFGGELNKGINGLRSLLKYLSDPTNAGRSLIAPTGARWVIQSGSTALSYVGDTDGKADVILGFSGDDVIDGGGGSDLLLGGTGNDTYNFTSTFGKDIILDRDGQGSIALDGATLTGGNGAGKRNVWVGKDSAGNYEGYAVYDDGTSSTGKKLGKH